MAFSDPAMLGAPRYERRDRDFYPTLDEGVTTVLCRTMIDRGFLQSSATVWECAAGAGDMTRVLERHFNYVCASDVHPLTPEAFTRDFLVDPPVGCDAIITNPPYDRAEEFARRGLEHIRAGRTSVVAMLVRNEFDCAAGRSDLFGAPEHAARITLRWRPRWIADSTGSPRHNYSWHVWTAERRNHGPVALYVNRPEAAR